MRLHIERNQEPKDKRPHYFEATFRLEMDAEEQALAAHYCSNDLVVCGLTVSMMTGGPDGSELMKAKGVTFGKIQEGVTLRNWIDKLLEDEEEMVNGCRNLSAFMKAASSYQGAVDIEI